MVGRRTAVERYFDLNYSPFYLRSALLTSDWNLPADNAYLQESFGDSLGPDDADILSRVAYFEATTQLTSNMLVKVDRMSMANSLEIRCPLLDHKLAELAMTIPRQWKHARRPRQADSVEGHWRPPAAGAVNAAEERLRRPSRRTGFAARCAAFFGITSPAAVSSSAALFRRLF